MLQSHWSDFKILYLSILLSDISQIWYLECQKCGQFMQKLYGMLNFLKIGIYVLQYTQLQRNPQHSYSAYWSDPFIVPPLKAQKRLDSEWLKAYPNF